MRVLQVKYDDFDSKGKRKNGDTIPLDGGVLNQKKGIMDKHTITMLAPVEGKEVHGVAVILDNPAESKAFISKLFSALN